MTNVGWRGAPPIPRRHNILIISGSFGGHIRHTTYDRRQTTDNRQRHWYGISSPQVMPNKLEGNPLTLNIAKVHSRITSNLTGLPTGELKVIYFFTTRDHP